MTTITELHPPELPTTRILGRVSEDRARLLGWIDVIVGFVEAKHRVEQSGWSIRASLVDPRPDFRGGETVALQVRPARGQSLDAAQAPPMGALREMASRMVDALDGIANVVPDIACAVPPVAATTGGDEVAGGSEASWLSA